MKKLIIAIAALALFATSAAAQDLAQATESYNNGAAALSSGDKTGALSSFTAALTMAEALGEEGAEVVSNCKGVIPNLIISIAKDLIKSGKYDEAITSLKSLAAEAVSKYGSEEAAKEALGLVPTALLQQGTQLLKSKDAAGAIAAFKSALEADPTNGAASLRLGQALAATGKVEEAIEAYKTAAANGQEQVANKQIGTIYLKDAVKALQAKNYDAAVEAALQSIQFNETSNAYKIAGTAYTNLGKKAEAITNLSKYLELAPSAPDAAQIKAAIEALKK